MSQTIPKLNKALVGFLDILGFEKKLEKIQTDEDLTRLYADMRSIHKLFDKDPESQLTRQAHDVAAKKIITLSDALVVSVDFDSALVQTNGIIDTLHGELSDLAFSQALCTMEGYFLRGGIAKGFYFRDATGDILLSDAMAKAYATEGAACYPVFALDNGLHHFLMTHVEPGGYCAKHANIHELIVSTAHPKDQSAIHYLDYFRVAISMFNQWSCNDDLNAYKAEKDETKKNQIMRDSYTRSQLRFVTAHRDAIRVELAKPHDPDKVMPKYLWLKEYHNKSVDKYGFDKACKI